MSVKTGGRSFLFMAATAAAFGATAPALAQTEPADTVEEEIIVTAQRREQALSDVPAAISAITAEELEARNVDSLLDMQSSVPGLGITQTGIGRERVQLRGVSQQVGAPTVGVYMDEVSIAPQGAGGGAAIRTFDLERIEILRGPQPTLYGEGAMGGTIRYITAAPDLNDVVIRAETQFGTIEDGGTTGRGEAVLSTPLIDGKLAARVAVAYEDTGGYVDTLRGDDVNGIRYATVRGRLLYEPNANFSASLLTIYQDTQQDERDYANDDGDYFASSFAESSNDEVSISNLLLSYDFGPVTLLSSTGYFAREGETEDFFGVFFGGQRSVFESDRLSQELRLSSDGGGPLNYLLGASYTQNSAESASVFSFPGGPPWPPLGPVVASESTVLAVYGELGYDFGNLAITGGARFFQDEQSGRNNTLTQTFDSFNPRLNIAYSFAEGGLLYANVAKGFRTGGFNVAGDPATFEPEELWSYEVGLKNEFFDDRITVDASVYHNAWQNVQVPIVDLMLAQGRTTNGGEASGFGVDFAVRAELSDDLTLSGTVGWTDMAYDTTSLTHNAGDPLDLVAEWTASIALDYRHPISANSEFFARLDLGYQSEMQSTIRSLTPIIIFFPPGSIEDISFIPERETVNTRFGIENSSFEIGRLTAYIYGQNLTNDFSPIYGAGTVVVAQGVRPRPRTIGIGFSVAY